MSKSHGISLNNRKNINQRFSSVQTKIGNDHEPLQMSPKDHKPPAIDYERPNT